MRVKGSRIWYWVGVLLFPILVLGVVQSTTAETEAVEAVGTIAYSRGNEIRLIDTDGKNDRRIWQAPLPQGATGIRGLQWRPDGGALAFGSGFQWLCSQYSSDIYTISANGGNLKRLTNSPACDELAGFPKGSVKVRLDNATTEAIFGVYVEGAPEAVVVTLNPGAAVDLTIPDVADLGNFPQAVTVINGKFRWLDPSVTVDVKANQVTAASNTFFLTGQGNVFADVGGAFPTWYRDRSKVGFLFQEGFPSQISATPAVGESDTFILAQNAGVVASNGMVWSPVSDWLLYATAETIGVVEPGAGDAGIPLITKDALTEIVLGMDWLPDESGFIFSITSGQFGPERSNIYEFDFASNQLVQITDFDVEYAGALSLSPDGGQIVYEFAPDGNAPREIWIMNRDGSGGRSLGVQGAYPDWRPGTGIDFTNRILLPMQIRR